MKKIKDINWFWKNWTETEKKIYKKCAIFAIIVITIQIIAAVMCINSFHAASSDDGRWVTEWNDEKGEWERVWMPWGQGNDGTWGYQVYPDRALHIFQRMFNIIYTAVLPSASAIATILIGYNFCMIMTSKNPRKIDDSYTSIKVVATTWLYIMLASIFITLGMQGFNTIINSKWANPIIRP